MPEGAVAMPEGSVILVEIERQTLSRVAPDGSIHAIADLDDASGTVDASVAIKWLLPDRAGAADSERALALLSRKALPAWPQSAIITARPG